MQDRFKFRVYDAQYSRMLYPIGDEESVEIDGNGKLVGVDKIGVWNGGGNCTLMQCTGIKDRNDNLIYEGDIIYITSEEQNAKIQWSDDLARFTIHFENIQADFDNYYPKELEVIGNIYEYEDLV